MASLCTPPPLYLLARLRCPELDQDYQEREKELQGEVTVLDCKDVIIIIIIRNCVYTQYNGVLQGFTPDVLNCWPVHVEVF